MPTRLKLKMGFHTDNDANGVATLFEPGDVFVSPYNYAKRWPEKFERVEDYIPLSGGTKKLTGGTTIEDEENDDVAQDAILRASSPENNDEPRTEVVQLPTGQPQLKVKEPTRQPDDQVLNQMTVNDLKSYAEDEEIDLQGATRKEDILKVIRQYRTNLVPK